MSAGALAILGPVWLALLLIILVSAVRAGKSEFALRLGCRAVSVLWVLAGAAVNAGLVISGSTYTGFADGAYLPFVQDTWESVVVPHPVVFIGLLVVFEATAGILVLFPGKARQGALVALITFTVTLVSFGWGFLGWAVPMTTALVLLLRAERRPARVRTPGAELTWRH